MRFFAAKGVTLLEVVAALALMGSLLAVVLVSGTAHLRQAKASERKRDAVVALDQFLARWSVSDFASEEADDAARSVGVRLSRPDAANLSGAETADLVCRITEVRNADFGPGKVLRVALNRADSESSVDLTWVELLVSR